jgi:hypothetical protein
MIMIKLKLTVKVVCRMGAIQINSGVFDEILEGISQKEELPPIEVSDILLVRLINILKYAFKM